MTSKTLGDIALPTPDEEIWRYSRIGDLRLGDYRPVSYQPTVDTPRPEVSVGGPPVVLVDDSPDVFATLNRDGVEEHGGQVALTIPAGVVLDEPIVIVHHIPGGTALVFPRLTVNAGANSEVTVVERFVSDGDGGGLALPVLQIHANDGARVNYLSINELSDTTWSIGHQQSVGERDSNLSLATVALGGDYARVRTEARAAGKGASTRQIALYFAGGTQMHDFRTIQDHDAPHTHSDLLFKGAVQDRAASVYTGMLSIREHAGGTAAYQTNRNLTLSAGAWAESVPNLDIRTNDVKCSHASTVGPIDDAQRFYLESRGVRPETAERLVVLGFFDEVLGQIPVVGLVDDLKAQVANKLQIGAPA